ncbi:uncharacterized protein LOC128775483 [Panthera pardus]|uniref:Uncharacterized protein LOC128775483 n=1 Tax=Panthera pardus TaxID=9691 RepID=A0A9W2V1X6_PANPR|nr:uncharacterized protein LOC128775483 [Panthera pardus]
MIVADCTGKAFGEPTRIKKRQRAQREQPTSAADSTILPLQATRPPDAEGNQPHHYWPFATSDLYNWKAQNPKFSEKPAGLIDLLDSVLFTHQPTWDDYQQLLQVLFTTEERERILNGDRKLVPGADGNPTTNQAQIDASFPLTRPQWDFNTAEVFTDTFSGWVEAYPTKHETAQTVAKKLLEDILPRYGFPAMVGSDNGPAFISQVTQAVAKAVGANWKLHCAYRPQSSGQVERMNRTLKETLTKLTMETGGDWVTLLPYALYPVRNTPYTLGFTPYEIMFGRPPPVIPSLRAELIAEFKDQELFLSLRGLQRVHEDIWPRLCAIYEAGPTPTPHQYRPGDSLCQEAPPRDPRAALEGTLHHGVDNPHRSQGRRHHDLGPSHPRSASGPLLDPEGLRHAMGHQSGPTQPAQSQATAHSTHLILVTLLTLLVIAHAAGSPHAPQNITWQIINTSLGTILNQTSQSHPRDTWFPELCVNLQTLFPLSP